MPPADPVEAVAAPEPGGERSAEPPPESGDLDLDALLFEAGPETDPDPAAPLLEPTLWPERDEPAPEAEAALPDHAMPEPNEVRAAIPTVAAGRPAAIPAGKHDPLAPLKAMSEEEKIALFE